MVLYPDEAPADGESEQVRWSEPDELFDDEPGIGERWRGRLHQKLGARWHEWSRRRPTTSLLVTGALIAGLLAGHAFTNAPPPAAAAGPGPSSSPSASELVAAAPPTVGECKQYTREAESGATEESEPVACSEDHDAIVVARIDEPGFDVNFAGNYTLATKAMVMCQRVAEHYLGMGQGVTFSRYSSAVYEPSQAQQGEGQHWIRCDLVKFSTWDGMMPVHGEPQGRLRKGPALTDAYCVTADAVAHGLPHVTAMESPELGEGPSQVECIGRHALVAVRRGHAGTPSGAQRACAQESRHFRALPLLALAPPEHFWNDEVLCVAKISNYETWLAKGRTLGPAA